MIYLFYTIKEKRINNSIFFIKNINKRWPAILKDIKLYVIKMINTRKVGNNNKRSKWEENKMRVKATKKLNKIDELEIKNLLKVKKQRENKRDNANSISSDDCSIINISKCNNKHSV